MYISAVSDGSMRVTIYLCIISLHGLLTYYTIHQQMPVVVLAKLERRFCSYLEILYFSNKSKFGERLA
jgi:hypothetical protein